MNRENINPYLKNLERVEYIITNNCTGKCKHCSAGEEKRNNTFISPQAASNALREICDTYTIKSVMTFGGEPMLFKESVFAVHNVAEQLNIPHRQLITNGFFTCDIKEISDSAEEIKKCGINDVLVSADSFHQEYINLDYVKIFINELTKRDVPVRLNPAWLVSKENKNPYNIKTREILNELVSDKVSEGEGNIIFPEGNAKVYLKEYFEKFGEVENPYKEDPFNLKSICIEADGTLLGGNIYKNSIKEIINNYGGDAE